MTRFLRLSLQLYLQDAICHPYLRSLHDPTDEVRSTPTFSCLMTSDLCALFWAMQKHRDRIFRRLLVMFFFVCLSLYNLVCLCLLFKNSGVPPRCRSHPLEIGGSGGLRPPEVFGAFRAPLFAGRLASFPFESFHLTLFGARLCVARRQFFPS